MYDSCPCVCVALSLFFPPGYPLQPLNNWLKTPEAWVYFEEFTLYPELYFPPSFYCHRITLLYFFFSLSWKKFFNQHIKLFYTLKRTLEVVKFLFFIFYFFYNINLYLFLSNFRMCDVVFFFFNTVIEACI